METVTLVVSVQPAAPDQDNIDQYVLMFACACLALAGVFFMRKFFDMLMGPTNES